MTKFSSLGGVSAIFFSFLVGLGFTRPWSTVESASFCSTSPRFEAKANCSLVFTADSGAIPKVFVKASGPTRPIQDIKDLKILEWNILNLFERKIPGNTDNSKSVSPSEPMAKPKEQTDGIARLINREDPDILILLEVENIQALKQYAETYHPGKYHELLIEGNDTRGIDVAFLVKRDLPFDIEMRSHKKYVDNQQNEITFSRDLPVLLFREQGKSDSKPVFIVAGTHYKSMRGSGSDPLSTEKRTSQVEATAQIFSELQTEFGKLPIVLGGDFNNDVTKGPEFNPLKNIGYRDSISLVENYKGPSYSHYYFSKSGPEFSQLDSVMLSSDIVSAKAFRTAQILEHIDDKGRAIPAPRNYDEREVGHPSDHLPTSVILNFQDLRSLSQP